MPRVVIVRFLDVAAAPRPNVRWTDRECDARLMGYLLEDERACARWTTVLRGIVVVALLVVGSMALLAW